MQYIVEEFSSEEQARLAPYVTNFDKPVFALRNLPEVTKGAVFARYSRSPKSLRRLLLDEFLTDQSVVGEDAHARAGEEKAAGLYGRVLNDFGDDSVAQLGFAHVACEQISNVLTKIIERGRLASYLEVSTRYIPFDSKPGGRWRYALEPDIAESAERVVYEETLDNVFATYSGLLEPMTEFLAERFPRTSDDSEALWKRTIRAKACDSIRGLLPAATTSNVGVAASGQAFEALLLRLATHPLREAREYGSLMRDELDAVIPDFIKRVGVADRGGVWSDYLADTRSGLERIAEEAGLADADSTLGQCANPDLAGDGVTLVDYDPEAEVKIVAACLYPASRRPEAEIEAAARAMSHDERVAALRAAVGERRNRRHKPGRGFERSDYRFDIVCDYGAFRDLQRHRLLTVEWQELSPYLGYDMPEVVAEAGHESEFRHCVEASAELYEKLRAAGFGKQAQYVLSLAHNIRFSFQMNAREFFHLVELRSSAQGHPAYRKVAHAMHRAVAEVHPAIAEAMTYVDYSDVDLERLEAERRNARKQP